MNTTPLVGIKTISEAAEASKVSTWTIRREIKEGRLKARRIGRCTRILDDELDRWLHQYDEN